MHSLQINVHLTPTHTYIHTCTFVRTVGHKNMPVSNLYNRTAVPVQYLWVIHLKSIWILRASCFVPFNKTDCFEPHSAQFPSLHVATVHRHLPLQKEQSIMATPLDESMEVNQTGVSDFIAQMEVSGVVTPLEHSCLEGVVTWLVHAVGHCPLEGIEGLHGTDRMSSLIGPQIITYKEQLLSLFPSSKQTVLRTIYRVHRFCPTGRWRVWPCVLLIFPYHGRTLY